MKKVFFILIAILGSINSFSQGFSTKQGGHCFTLDVPDYMAKTFELNDVASLQYQNTAKEAYVIVIEDSKDEMESLGLKYISSKDFLESFIADYKMDSENRNLSSISDFDSNSNSHSQVELTWKEDDTEFYMLITAVETRGYFYKILCWTILPNKEKLKSDYLAIAKSIKD